MNKIIYLLPVTALFLAHCDASQTPFDDAIKGTHGAFSGNLTEYLEAGEPKVIAMAGGRADRDGDTLTLSVADGSKVELKNYADCKDGDLAPKDFDEIIEDRCFHYELQAVVPSFHVFLVTRVGYEFHQYMWIDDRNGKQTVLDGLPIVAPNRDFLFVYGDNDMNSYVTHKLYRLPTGGPPEKIWEGKDKTLLSLGEPRVKRWRRDEISIEFLGFPEFGEQGGMGVLSKDNETWNLKIEKR